MILSVIIPTYNSVTLIEECLSSIINRLNDTRKYEIIIVDGGSTDKTVAVVDSLAKNNKSICYISEKDEGIYDAMNKGIRVAKGDFLYFLGADDRIIFDIDYLEKKIINHNVIYYGNVILKDTKEIYDGVFDVKKIIEKNICHQAIFYPRKILENNPYNIEYELLADYELNLRLWKDYEFQYLDYSVAIYANDGISTREKDSKFRKDFLFLIYKYLGMKYAILKICNKIKRLL